MQCHSGVLYPVRDTRSARWAMFHRSSSPLLESRSREFLHCRLMIYDCLALPIRKAPFHPCVDGDIIHYTVSQAPAQRRAHLVWPLLCLAPRFRFGLVVVLLARLSAAVSFTQPPSAETKHWFVESLPRAVGANPCHARARG